MGVDYRPCNKVQRRLRNVGHRFFDALEVVAAVFALVVTDRSPCAGSLDLHRLTLRAPYRPIDHAARRRQRRWRGRARWRRRRWPILPVAIDPLLLRPPTSDFGPLTVACRAPIPCRSRPSPARPTWQGVCVPTTAVGTLRTDAFIKMDKAHATSRPMFACRVYAHRHSPQSLPWQTIRQQR